MDYNCVVVGSGFAGAVCARLLAEKGQKVLVVEKRDHIGGNAYDTLDENGILIHKYGPHIFHTNKKNVYDFLSRFTEWYDYSHKVLANIYGLFVPVPFNFNSIEKAFAPEKAKALIKKLTESYPEGSRVSILELKKSTDADIVELADYVYNNIFLRYTLKQWGQKPEDIDPSVTARVPVLLSRDDRYFQDTYQGMPLEGYTKLFENMLDHENISISLSTDVFDLISIKDNTIYVSGEAFSGDVIYTGEIDYLFNYSLGKLPYRTLSFDFETKNEEYVFPAGTINYTVNEDFTRITEFKHLTGQKCDKSTIMREYPAAFEHKDGQIPYYAIINEDNLKLYGDYKALADKIENLHLLGRLAEYKYYNMDDIVARALSIWEE